MASYLGKKVIDCTKEEVVAWAREVLRFDEDSGEILLKAKVDGPRLIGSIRSVEWLESQGIPGLEAVELWDAIKQMQPQGEDATLLTTRPALLAVSTHERPLKDKKRPRAADLADSDGEETRPKKRQKTKHQHSTPPRGQPTVNQTTAWVLREADWQKMTETFNENMASLAFRPTTIAIGGPCGIGKTRLALEFIQGKQFDIKILVDVPPGCQDVNKLLGPHLGLKEATVSDSLMSFVLVVLEKEQKPNTRLKLAIYLDEIQNLDYRQLIELHHAIRLCTKWKEQIGIQLIISGTHLAYLRASFNEDDWTNLHTGAGGLILINLQPLKFLESSQLLEDVISKVHKRSNAKDTVKKPFVIESLRWLGGNPRLIEFLADTLIYENLDNCSAKKLLNAVKKKYWQLYSERLGKSEEYYKLIAALCLSRVKLTLGTALTDGNDAITIKKLILQGSVVWTPSRVIDADGRFGTNDAEGYVSLPLAVIRWYISKENISTDAFSLKLFVPDTVWKWEAFEDFTAELVALRLRAYWMCGRKTVSLKELFEGISMSPNIENHEVPLGPFTVTQLKSHCRSANNVRSDLVNSCILPLELRVKNTEDPEEKEIAKETLQKARAELNFLVVRNLEKAPSWDAAVYVNGSIVLAIQTKHTAKTENIQAVTKALVLAERKKVPATIPLLFITNRTINKDVNTLVEVKKAIILVHNGNLTKTLGSLGELWRFTYPEEQQAVVVEQHGQQAVVVEQTTSL